MSHVNPWIKFLTNFVTEICRLLCPCLVPPAASGEEESLSNYRHWTVQTVQTELGIIWHKQLDRTNWYYNNNRLSSDSHLAFNLSISTYRNTEMTLLSSSLSFPFQIVINNKRFSYYLSFPLNRFPWWGVWDFRMVYKILIYQFVKILLNLSRRSFKNLCSEPRSFKYWLLPWQTTEN